MKKLSTVSKQLAAVAISAATIIIMPSVQAEVTCKQGEKVKLSTDTYLSHYTCKVTNDNDFPAAGLDLDRGTGAYLECKAEGKDTDKATQANCMIKADPNDSNSSPKTSDGIIGYQFTCSTQGYTHVRTQSSGCGGKGCRVYVGCSKLSQSPASPPNCK